MFRSTMNEFKTFAMRGNVIDLAVGIIIGAAFGKIITSLVNDIIMPPVGKLLGGVDFTDLFVPLETTELTTLAKVQEAGIPVIAYGQFINTLIDFVIVAFCIFLVVKFLNKLARKKQVEEQPVDPTTRECSYCLSDVPLAASRCAHCTSELVPVIQASPQKG